MRKFQGLEKLCLNQEGLLTPKRLAQLLITDLAEAQMLIYGRHIDDKPVLLAILNLLPDSLQYDPFDQRLDLVFAGQIIADSSPALTYCLQGREFSVTGRCSTIPKICGVDLYLSRTFTRTLGDIARQPFAISMKDLK